MLDIITTKNEVENEEAKRSQKKSASRPIHRGRRG